MKKLEDIEIEIIPKLFSTLLFNKFRFLRVKTIGDILNLKLKDFLNIKGVGLKSISDLYKLKQKIRTNPDKYLDYYNNTIQAQPNLINEQEKAKFRLLLLDESILEFINQISPKRARMIILYSFGLNGNKVYKAEEIGSIIKITPESVWQIKIRAAEQIVKLLKQELQNNFQTNTQLAKLFKKLNNLMQSSEVLTFKQLKDILYVDFNYEVASRDDGTMQLILCLLGLELDNMNNCQYIKAKYFFCHPTQKNGLSGRTQLAKEMKNHIAASIEQENAIIDVIRKKGKMKKIEITEPLQGVENQELENQNLNPDSFELLTTENRVYRILKAKAEHMHITEIISELNRQLLDLNSTEVYQNTHLDLTADDRFKCNSNIGYYELAEWNREEETGSGIFEKEIHMPPEPSPYIGILNKIKERRQQSDNKTINGLINVKCLGLKNRD